MRVQKGCCIMQGRNELNGEELCKAEGGGTNSIVANTQNIKTNKNYER